MTEAVHPSEALFGGEKPFPIIATCEHFAGSEKLIQKALALQEKLGPIFDITCDCEDGAPAGKEREHAEMIVRVQNSAGNKFRQAGVRIHDYSHPAWKQDVDILVEGLGDVTAYITIPKTTDVNHLREMVEYIQAVAARNGIKREIPLHALIETHGALRDVQAIAATPWVQVLDFGLMDFVSGHHGAIPAAAMRSPGQFDHELLRRAKAEVVAAALANGVVEDAANILMAAQNVSWGPIQYQGELHDRATYRYFWDLLRKARVTGIAMPAEAERRFFA
jgi:citrate lyase subunit beta/citryl-CoA lyase